MDNLTNTEAFILVIFFLFALLGFMKTEILLEMQKKVYKVIGVKYEYSKRTIFLLRGVMIFAIIMIIFIVFIL